MKNLFTGDSWKALFANSAYNLLMSRQWITYADVMAEVNHLASAKELENSVSNHKNYGDLKKAFPVVCKAIREKEGENCIEERGNNRNKSFRYVGKDNDPLADMIHANTIKHLRQYWQFCQDSAGFFPTSWLEYFFSGSQDLIQMKLKKRRGEQVINIDQDRQLKNIELLPELYENIINHQVLSITYKPFDEDILDLIFHPHLLKEYNGRWFLLGHAEGREPEYGFNLALDRIVSKPRLIKTRKWCPPLSGFYKDLFRNIVGVSRIEGNQVHTIRIRAHRHYIYRLTETKKIHPSQETILPYGKHDDGEYGDFIVRVAMNDEFIGRILQMGAGLEIIEPIEVRQVFEERVRDLSHLYDGEGKQ